MAEFRRGLVMNKARERVMQTVWHFNESCQDYPNRNFVTLREKPLNAELCTRCTSKSGK